MSQRLPVTMRGFTDDVTDVDVDGGKSVAEYLKSVNNDLKVLGFKRVALG